MTAGSGDPLRPDVAPARDEGATTGGRVFLSHSSTDVAAARAVRAILEPGGYACWMAPDDVAAGRPWASQIVEAIEWSTHLVVLLSGASVASEHVAREVALATEQGKHVVPLRLDPSAPQGALRYQLQLIQRWDIHPGPIKRHRRRILEAMADSSWVDLPIDTESVEAVPAEAGLAETIPGEVDALPAVAGMVPGRPVADTTPPSGMDRRAGAAIIGVVAVVVLALIAAVAALGRPGASPGATFSSSAPAVDEQPGTPSSPGPTPSSPAPGPAVARIAWVDPGRIDGSAILVADISRGGIGEPRVAGYGRFPALSPDGTWVAYVADGALRLARAEGGARDVALELPADVSGIEQLSWAPETPGSPGRQRLAFTAEDEDSGVARIVLAELLIEGDTATLEELCPLPGGDRRPRSWPAWSTDGTSLAWGEPSGMWTGDATCERGISQQLLRRVATDGWRLESPAWSRGSLLATAMPPATADSDPRPCLGSSIKRVDTSRKPPVTDDAWDVPARTWDCLPAASPGGVLGYLRQRDGRTILMLRMDGTEREVATLDLGDSTNVPDGLRPAVADLRAGPALTPAAGGPSASAGGV